MGRELMAPRTDRTTRIPSGVASPVATNHRAKGFVFVRLKNGGNFQKWPTWAMLKAASHESRNLKGSRPPYARHMTSFGSHAGRDLLTRESKFCYKGVAIHQKGSGDLGDVEGGIPRVESRDGVASQCRTHNLEGQQSSLF
jgi:hypothetical protein